MRRGKGEAGRVDEAAVVTVNVTDNRRSRQMRMMRMVMMTVWIRRRFGTGRLGAVDLIRRWGEGDEGRVAGNLSKTDGSMVALTPLGDSSATAGATALRDDGTVGGELS